MTPSMTPGTTAAPVAAVPGQTPQAVGLASRGSVHRKLLILELKGAIERDASTSRGIRLVDAGGAP